jgi:hypothetical protein
MHFDLIRLRGLGLDTHLQNNLRHASLLHVLPTPNLSGDTTLSMSVEFAVNVRSAI